MEKFTHKFTVNEIPYKLPTIPNFVQIKIFGREMSLPLSEISYNDLVEYAEAVKQSIIRKHKK